MKKENVLYRINKLYKNGIIAGTYTAIDLKKFGYSSYRVYIQTKNLSAKKEEELIQYLIKHPYVSWVITATGRWDLIIQIFSKTAESFDNTLTQIDNKYGNYIKKKMFFIEIEFHHFTHTYLKEKNKPPSLKEEKTNSKKPNIDNKDIEIMELLTNNSRLSLTEIGKKLNLSNDTVSYKIKKLVKQEIITRFSILRNKHLLGNQFFSLLLNLDRKNDTPDFLNFAETDERINTLTKQIGEYNYALGIDCKSNLDFNNLLKKIKELFGNIIKSYEVIIKFDLRHFTYLPSGIAQDLKQTLTSPQHNQALS